MATFGERVRRLRTERGITQKELAQHMQITIASVSHWERDDRGADMKHILQLADYFGVSIDYLLGRSDIRAHPAEAFDPTDPDWKDHPYCPITLRRLADDPVIAPYLEQPHIRAALVQFNFRHDPPTGETLRKIAEYVIFTERMTSRRMEIEGEKDGEC